MQDNINNQAATKGDLKVLETQVDGLEQNLGKRIDTVEKTIQEDIYEVGKIVATKDDLQQGLDKTRGAIVTDIKDHIDKKMGELKGDLISTQNKTIEAVKRFADVFERTQNLSDVDQDDMVAVKQLLEVR